MFDSGSTFWFAKIDLLWGDRHFRLPYFQVQQGLYYKSYWYLEPKWPLFWLEKARFGGLTFKNRWSPGGSAGTKVQVETGKTFWTGIITPQKKSCAFNHGWIIKSCSVPGGCHSHQTSAPQPPIFWSFSGLDFWGGRDRPIEDFLCLDEFTAKKSVGNPHPNVQTCWRYF